MGRGVDLGWWWGGGRQTTIRTHTFRTKTNASYSSVFKRPAFALDVPTLPSLADSQLMCKLASVYIQPYRSSNFFPITNYKAPSKPECRIPIQFFSQWIYSFCLFIKRVSFCLIFTYLGVGSGNNTMHLRLVSHWQSPFGHGMQAVLAREGAFLLSVRRPSSISSAIWEFLYRRLTLDARWN